MQRFGKRARVREVGFAGFTPDQVGVRRIGHAPRDGLLQTGACAIKAFDRALSGEKRPVVFVDVGSQ